MRIESIAIRRAPAQRAATPAPLSLCEPKLVRLHHVALRLALPVAKPELRRLVLVHLLAAAGRTRALSTRSRLETPRQLRDAEPPPAPPPRRALATSSAASDLGVAARRLPLRARLRQVAEAAHATHLRHTRRRERRQRRALHAPERVAPHPVCTEIALAQVCAIHPIQRPGIDLAVAQHSRSDGAVA